MNAGIRGKMEALFTKEEVAQVEKFFDRGFPPNSQIFIASVFLMAKDRKSVAEVLIECEKEWQRNWQYQHPDIRGDAGAPGAAGVQNRLSLENIYNALDLPHPSNVKESEIPAKAIVVTTRNSIYRFGEANERGERTVSRDLKPLDFSRCRIISLGVDQEMELVCLHCSHPSWYTTNVISIR